MAIKMTRYPARPYPDDDNEKLNLLFIYLFKNKEWQFIDRLGEYLGWEIDDSVELHIKKLLIECGQVHFKPFGNKGSYIFKIKDEAIEGIHKYGSYKEWKQTTK